MASAGSSFDFAADDLLCSYDDVISHDLSNGKRSDRLEKKDLHESRVGRPLVSVYGQQDEYQKEEIINVVEKCMKKYADNLTSQFEGISGRLSQLEIHCYKLERSIGEFRADSIRDQGEVDAKLKSVVKHLQEVHRSVQIIRDKQELAETHNELTKLQVAPKESNSPTQSQKSDTSSSSLASEPKQHNSTHDIPNTNLALALPHQIPPPHDHYIINQSIPFHPQQSQALQLEPHYIQSRPRPPIPQPHQVFNQAQQQSFVNHIPNHNYIQSRPQISDQQQHTQVVNQTQHQPFTNPNLNPTSNYMQSRHQIADPLIQSLPPPQQQQQQQQTQVINHVQPQPFPHYHQPPTQTLIVRTPTPPTYPEIVAYGASGSMNLPNQSQLQGYSTVYSIDGSRVQSYAHPSNVPGIQNQQMHPSNISGFQQIMRVHPYADMIEKAASMGFSKDQVVVVVNKMAENGQPVDFNALLDKLNSSARAWSG